MRGDTGALYSLEEVLEETHADASLVRELEEYGVVRGDRSQVGQPGGGPRYDETEREIVRAVTELARYGVGGRNLRVFRSSADREASLLQQILAPALRSRNPQRRKEALEALENLAAVTTHLQPPAAGARPAPNRLLRRPSGAICTTRNARRATSTAVLACGASHPRSGHLRRHLRSSEVPTARSTRTIAAPAGEVWELVSDPHHLPRWWPRVARVEGVERDAFTQVLASPRGRLVRADFHVVAADERALRLVWGQEVDGTPFARVLAAAETETAPAAGGAGDGGHDRAAPVPPRSLCPPGRAPRPPRRPGDAGGGARRAGAGAGLRTEGRKQKWKLALDMLDFTRGLEWYQPDIDNQQQQKG